MNWTSAVQSVTITANKPNNTNTTSEESEPRNLHEDINVTHMSSPETEQWNETTPVSSPAPDLTSSEVTTASAAAHVRVTHHPKAPVQENENQNQTNHFAAGKPQMCCLGVSSIRVPLAKIKACMHQPRPLCPIDAIILITHSGKMMYVLIQGRCGFVEPFHSLMREMIQNTIIG
ncbi:uncharacterized protein AKAME5_001564100 [Lates japonicus]|uniref:Chemokine interleukin-8-like domain-containing protein n=1 Tax=Lates japonicus TaxID=270547 RepID=A0AAD3MZL1_LATJO|nr:uncharacterized protein AKAME5_001564100 [Lates japonicus]